MKATKKQLESSILFFAKLFNKEDNYKALMSTTIHATLPELVKMIVYEMFLQKYDPNAWMQLRIKSLIEENRNYLIIHEYATELNEKGFVTFGD